MGQGDSFGTCVPGDGRRSREQSVYPPSLPSAEAPPGPGSSSPFKTLKKDIKQPDRNTLLPL